MRDRITAWDAKGAAYYPECFARCEGLPDEGACLGCDVEAKICARLAEYEDLCPDPAVLAKQLETLGRRTAAEKRSEGITGAEALSEMDREVLVQLAANSLDVTKTARALFVHRNTVVYHILRVKQVTGLDPKNLIDLVKLTKEEIRYE